MGSSAVTAAGLHCIVLNHLSPEVLELRRANSQPPYLKKRPPIDHHRQLQMVIYHGQPTGSSVSQLSRAGGPKG
ncbi:hypothetical protein OUZ56_008748 [Daphnia magna]|uniref:Uncharacterized protein n=1 Tax=Daphnia magna TaxID=35525 RepID=A0ABR0ADX3_9CRUS|nr:hypothetical protein OUZ56_008748 [Daphnia magna]